MRKVLKRVPVWLIILVTVLIATPVLAWVVYQGTIANVSVSVRRAEASWEPVDIAIGDVNAGANFSATGLTVLTIANAEMLNVSFSVVTLSAEELAALESLTITIGEDTNDDGEIDVMWGTIENNPIPLPSPGVMLSSGDYSVVILVEGIAGYPEVETPVGFTVEATCEATPITLP